MLQKRGCPFCHCNSTQVLSPKSKPNTSTHGLGFQIECINCGARGPSGLATPEEASRVWSEGDGQGQRASEPLWVAR